MYIEGLIQRFLQDEYLYQQPSGTIGAAENRFRRVLQDLREASVYDALPEALRSEAFTEVVNEMRERLGRYDVHDTPIGDLELNFNRLYLIWQALGREHTPASQRSE